MKTYLVAVSVLFVVMTASSARADIGPVFNLEEGWISPTLELNPDPFWAPAGLTDVGMTFYTSGAPLPGSPYWERFNPQSPLYQAWFGAYVANPNDPAVVAEWALTPRNALGVQATARNVEALVRTNQLAWLHGFGDPHPHADLSDIHIRRAHDGFFQLRVAVSTDSDVGDGQTLAIDGTPAPLPFYPPFSQNSSLVSPYAPVSYEATILFRYDLSSGRLLVVFASSCRWTLLDGSEHETPDAVTDDQEEMLATTTFQ